MDIKFDRSTLLHCLLYWERKSPYKKWLIQPVGDHVVTYTWKQASEIVKKLANYLMTLNFEPKSNIIIVGKNSAEWLMADLAIMAAGHVSIPVYYTINAENIAYIIQHSEAKLLIAGKIDSWEEMKCGLPDDLPKIRLCDAPNVPNSISIEDIVGKYSPLAVEKLKLPDAADLATIIYTSGSTGQPKGVMHNHKNMINAASNLYHIFKVDQDDRMISYLPLAHTVERFVVETCSLYYGFEVYFADSIDTFLEDIKRAKPTIFFSVPRLWVKFQQGIYAKLPLKLQNIVFKVPFLSTMTKKFILKKLGLDHVRIAVTGSAPLSPDIISWYCKIGMNLHDAYAMTENFAYSHMTRPDKLRIGAVGQPCPGVECKISDKGELLIKSPSNMLGYYKEPEKTAEFFDKDGFLKTGDMGIIDRDNFLFITGRVKDIFKTTKGKYISPVPIEQILGNHPSIESACVMGNNLPSPLAVIMMSEEISTLLEKHPEQQVGLTENFRELLHSINQQLASHEKLSKLIITRERWTIENGMLTPTLKIRRHEIELFYKSYIKQWEVEQAKVLWI